MNGAWRNVTLGLSILAGLICAVAVGIAAWDLNSQGEYHDWQTGAVHWRAFGPLLGIVFGFGFVSVLVLSGMVFVVLMLARKFTK